MRVSFDSAAEEQPTRVSFDSAGDGQPMRISFDDAAEDTPLRISFDSSTEDQPLRISFDSTGEDTPMRISFDSTSDDAPMRISVDDSFYQSSSGAQPQPYDNAYASGYQTSAPNAQQPQMQASPNQSFIDEGHRELEMPAEKKGFFSRFRKRK